VSKAAIGAVGLLALVGSGACARDDLSRVSLGSVACPDIADKYVLFDGKPIPDVLFRQLTKAVGDRVQDVACHGVSMVAEARSGNMREGGL